MYLDWFRSLCTGSLITLDTNIITAGLRIYPLIQILAKDYELTYSEKAISNLFYHRKSC